jgi:uncharacterized OsmC-like protein
MKSTAFLALQAPLKEQYRRDAKSALLTLRARGDVDKSSIACRVETGRGLAVAGMHPKAGGNGEGLCSGDMLLEALIACAGVAMKAAATVLDVPVKSLAISAEGDIDLRGTLGVADDVPVGITDIRLHFDVVSDAPREKLDQLLELTERYCVVYHTLRAAPRIDVRMSTARA